MPNIEPEHPSLEAIQPYKPADLDAIADRAGLSTEQLIRLGANENPFGPSPKAVQAMTEYANYGFYPDYEPLREAIACYADVSPGQVVLGNGADELIDLLIRLFVEPGQIVIDCPPTFGMYRFYAQVNRCRALSVPRRADLSLDAVGIERAVEESEGEPRLLFLVSPGNPSGQAIPPETFRRLLGLPLIVAVDEAYIEFGGESVVPLLPDHENLVVIRTFSKWAGLAGLRLGYALLAPRFAGQLERIRAPYNVNAAAVAAALATLNDLEAVRGNVTELIAERERLREELAELPWLEPLPSQTNFILCRVIGRDPQGIVDALARQGILIRGFSDPRMAEYIRISVGRPDQNDELLSALQEMRGRVDG